jgi:hypothetical protein
MGALILAAMACGGPPFARDMAARATVRSLVRAAVDYQASHGRFAASLQDLRSGGPIAADLAAGEWQVIGIPSR